MSRLIINTTIRETMTSIAAAMCAIWEADADTPAVYAEHCRVHNADLHYSVIAHMPDGAFAGIGILCRRGDRGFVLDFGIAPAYRGQKYGHRLFAALLDNARRARLREVLLIVEADNDPARRIYEAAGFAQQREVVSLRGNVPAYAPAHAEERPGESIPASILAWYGAGRSAVPIWERELPSLLAMSDVRAFEHAEGFLLCRPSPYFRQIDIVHLGLQPSAQAEDLNALLYAASAAYGSNQPLALPEEPRDSRAFRLLQTLGFRPVSRAYEMKARL